MKKRTAQQSEKVHQQYHKHTRKSLKVVKKNNFTYRHLIGHVDKFKLKGARVLDIGCGAGSLSFYIASRGGVVTGIDISKKAVMECKKSSEALGLKNTKFIHCYFPNQFSSKEKYDYVIFTEVIEHLEDDKFAIKKISTLLKKNGVLLLSTPSITAPLHRLKLTKKFDEQVGHLRRYSIDQLRNLMTKNDFKITSQTKSEGILRNFLFINPHAGKLVRYINRFGSDIVTYLDNMTLQLFGESNYIIVAKKIGKKKQKTG